MPDPGLLSFSLARGGRGLLTRTLQMWEGLVYLQCPRLFGENEDINEKK